MNTFGSWARATKSGHAGSICDNRSLVARSIEMALRAGAWETRARVSVPLVNGGTIGGATAKAVTVGIAASFSVFVRANIGELISLAGAK
jgi:hypothetical protein